VKLTSIWVNEMKDNEYNPIHVHQGDLFTGLSSVMILGLPSHYGKEYSAEDTVDITTSGGAATGAVTVSLLIKRTFD